MSKPKKSKDRVEAWLEEHEADADEVIDWLQHHDVVLFADDVKVNDARKRCQKEVNCKVPAYVFAALRLETCEWWKCRTVHRRPRVFGLTEKSWRRVKEVIKGLEPVLHELTKEQCIRVIRTEVQCDDWVLDGLEKRYQVWAA